ncbi:hypothetical protein niasHT_028753 [Heterodera trifolii]|uniref:BTB domain-containing protein n=1 Tax=Heterodera trifolii TaxID=157864 RepID=A0ABD2KQA7_9BILA
MSLPSSESANLSDRMKVLLSTANGADIHFLVGEEKKLFRAHKHILTLSSEVFEAMFRYDAQNAKAEEQSKPVKVPDIEPEAFKVMLSFIYADDLSGLNGENAMAVLYAVPSGVLTNEEFVSIYQFHCHPNLRGVPGLKPLKFPWHGRISDWNIAKGNRGTLTVEIEKFSEFAREKVISYRESGTDVFINGLPWKIFAYIRTKNDSTEKGMVFGLLCTVPKQDYGNLSCKCSATLRIISQKSGTANLTVQYNSFFSNKLMRFPFFITFTELMDPSKGFYDKDADKVTLAIDLTVEKEKGTKRKLADE